MYAYKKTTHFSLDFSKIREELGMKPLSRDKFSSLSSPSTRENKPSLKKVTSYLWTMLPLNSKCCIIL